MGSTSEREIERERRRREIVQTLRLVGLSFSPKRKTAGEEHKMNFISRPEVESGGLNWIGGGIDG